MKGCVKLTEKFTIDHKEWHLERKIEHCNKMLAFAMSKKATALWSSRLDQSKLELENYLKSKEVAANE